MRRLLLLLPLALACAQAPASTSSPGDLKCPAGEIVGPLGTCVDRDPACSTCATNADCKLGMECVLDGNGCSACGIGDTGGGGEPICIDNPNTACHHDVECCHGTLCRTADDPPTCGICQPSPADTCTNDEQCGANAVCAELPPLPCACDPTPFHQCQPKCPGEPCPDGSTCDATGHCQPFPCISGFGCPPGEMCQPGAGGADVHGCVARFCRADPDCPSGFCVNGRCTRSAGSCQPMAE